jgi:DNA-binding CsgD family transcriptional regulator
VRQALDARIKAVGFDRFSYLMIRPPQGPRVRFFITSFPEKWAGHYIDNDFINIDPVVSAISSRVLPFRWNELDVKGKGKSAPKRVINEARDFCLFEGATVPLHGPGPALANLSVASDAPPEQFSRLWEEHRDTLHLIAVYAHETIVDHVYTVEEGTLYNLTQREKECLLWTAKGKTAWEVSTIFGISEETVVSHLKNAARKLGVHSKSHAVVKAVMQGLIVP